MIKWYCEAAREDSDPQRFDAQVGHLFLRVVEVDERDVSHHYRWGVSTREHPPFADEIDELSVAMGNHVDERGAKNMCRAVVRRLIGAVENDL